jgi:hypothetical protein
MTHDAQIHLHDTILAYTLRRFHQAHDKRDRLFYTTLVKRPEENSAFAMLSAVAGYSHPSLD